MSYKVILEYVQVNNPNYVGEVVTKTFITWNQVQEFIKIKSDNKFYLHIVSVNLNGTDVTGYIDLLQYVENGVLIECFRNKVITNFSKFISNCNNDYVRIIKLLKIVKYKGSISLLENNKDTTIKNIVKDYLK
jgi:hypothetical protein